MSADDVRAKLFAQVETVALTLLGEANRAMSTKWQLRFGRRGSLAVEIAGERRGLWHDFESGEGGDLLDLVRRVRGTHEFGETLAEASKLFGAIPLAAPFAKASGREDSKLDLAAKIWRESVPARGTPVERYLREARGLGFVETPNLRFHAACPRRTECCPAMVARMSSIEDGRGRAIHRTFLNLDGSKAQRGPYDPVKAMLGPARGAAIMLSPFETVTGGLFICEGIEDGVAAILGGWAPVWALGSAGSICRFPVLAGIESLTIVADRDAAGASAADACASRWLAAGREVRIVEPVSAKDWAALQALS